MAERNPQQELEDYAIGRYSPQRGGMLPVAQQGGLPLGGTPPAPQAPAAPPVSFQAAPTPPQRPLTQLGGQTPNINQMIAQHLQALQNYSQAGYWDKFLDRGDVKSKRHQALRQIPLLQGVAAGQRQSQELQQKYLSEIAGNLKEWGGLSTEERFRQKGLTAKLLRANARLAGMEVSDEDIEQVLTSDNVAGAYTDLFDGTLSEQDRQGRLTRLGSVQGAEREAVAATLRKEDDAKALTLIKANMPRVVQMLGGTPDKPMDMATFNQRLKADPELSKFLSGSPVLQRNLTTFLTDKNNAETLAGWGLKPGVTSLEEQKLRVAEEVSPKFPNLEPYTKTLLPFMVKGSGLSHTQLDQMARTDPNRFAAIVTEAQATYDQRQLDIASAQGREAARIRLETPEKATTAERKELIESENTIGRLRAVQQLYDSSFVGPITGRAGVVREQYTGDITSREAEFRSRVTSFNNQMIKDITGAQMSEPEAKRIKAELPNVNLPPVTFEARLRQSQDNAILLQYKRRMILEQTGVDLSNLPPLPPLPDRFRGHAELFDRGAVGDEPPKPPKNPPLKRSGLPTRTR